MMASQCTQLLSFDEGDDKSSLQITSARVEGDEGDQRPMINVRTIAASCFLTAVLVSACGGSGPSNGTGKSGYSSSSCCLNYSYYTCPSEGDAKGCFDNGRPGKCTSTPSKDKDCCAAKGDSCTGASQCCSGTCGTDGTCG